MRVLAFEGGAWRQSEELAPEAARDLVWGPTHVWIRLEGLAADKLESLGTLFDLHPLAIEDVRSHRQRPKVEDYPQQTFVVARAPRWNEADGEMGWVTLGMFLGPDFLVTACTDHVAELDAVEKRLLAQKVSPRTSSIDHVFYQVLDAVVDAYFPIMDDMEDRIETLEAGVLEGADRQELAQIQDFKHIVSQVRKTIYPMREVMVALERGEFPNIRDETRLYLRDVADHMTRLAERLEHVKEVAVLTQETWNATLANQTNVVVRRLTVITVLLLVPNLLAQIGGMNFMRGFPPWDFWLVTSAILGVTVIGLLALLWRRWL